MRVQSGQLVALGYGKYVRSEEVVAIEPITEGRGPGRRSLVWVRGLPDPLVASRAEGSIIDDLVTPVEEAARMKAQRAALRSLTTTLDSVSPGVRRVLAEETGTDIEELLDQANRVLG
ncbi:MAG: hypothetical protein IIC72_11780 [Acidobacteria bacterium]|nr:hypothetical protein [Acidobacteriota bacterium]TDI49081.1 MAG: hypothetical protein E2O97_09875 [Acidobacteriota bacterium]TDI49403.1 MAG: hypothetical protein E2O98_05715 [Acidobacteriota bacterium]